MVGTGSVLKKKWRDFAQNYEVPESEWLQVSNGWLQQWKKSRNIASYKRHGEAASAAAASIDAERSRSKTLLQDENSDDVFNETPLFYE